MNWKLSGVDRLSCVSVVSRLCWKAVDSLLSLARLEASMFTCCDESVDPAVSVCGLPVLRKLNGNLQEPIKFTHTCTDCNTECFGNSLFRY